MPSYEGICRNRWTSAVAVSAVLVIVLALATSALDVVHTVPARAAMRPSFCDPARTAASFGVNGAGSSRGIEARLVAIDRTVHSGRSPKVRLVNSGSSVLGLDGEYTQRWSGGSWRKMRLPPYYVTAPVQTVVQPAAVSRCTGPLTLRRWPAGKYRWILAVRVVGSGGPSGRRYYLPLVFHLHH